MSMTSFAILATEGGERPEFHLPIPAWSYGALALAIFLILLGVVWSFRNAGHTLMTQPDIVEHGHGTAPGAPTPGGHGSAH